MLTPRSPEVFKVFGLGFAHRRTLEKTTRIVSRNAGKISIFLI